MAVDRSLVTCSLALVLALFGGGCGSEPEPEPEAAIDALELGDIANLYLEYIDLLNGVDLHFCGCSVADGEYATMQECVAAAGGPVIPPLLANCYAQVFDGMESVREYVECQFSEYMQFIDCLESMGCGGELASCQELLGDADCPKLPYAANAALASECLGYEMPAPFECTDGTQIVPWFECNFWPDCPDQSDEHASCPKGFECMDGSSIPEAWRCDGGVDCPDGDDEIDCG